MDERQNCARILVVDDEELSRMPLVVLLRELGHEVLEAESGERALAYIRQGSIDLVLLDVVMPEMDGFETCRRIRSSLGMLTLPIVFVTSLDDHESRVRAKAVGADDFLSKPIDVTELTVRVHNLLRVKAYHDLQARQREVLESELERMREQLIRTDRMATLGTLAAGVGHELNNIITVLVGALEFINENVRRGLLPEQRDLDECETVLTHLETHARQLLTLGHPGPDYTERFDLREVVGATLTMLRTTGKTKYLEVESNLPPSAVWVSVSRTRVEQVLLNLLGNAADAVRACPNGQIRVSILPLHDSRIFCRVEDNGAGIAPGHRDTIFEPYFTTKAPGEGTGLGLCVVRNIVESYGGSVRVESEVGVGTAFEFDLPSAAPPFHLCA